MADPRQILINSIVAAASPKRPKTMQRNSGGSYLPDIHGAIYFWWTHTVYLHNAQLLEPFKDGTAKEMIVGAET